MGLQYSSFEGGKVFYKAAPAGQNMISLPIKNIGTGSTSDSTVQGIGSKKQPQNRGHGLKIQIG
jgi:hypothetical protein